MVTAYAIVNYLNRIVAITSESNGSVIEITDKNVVDNPQNYKYVSGNFVYDPCPSAYHTLDANGDWQLNNDLLTNIKEEKWQEIKAYRDKRQLSGFQLSNHWFHSDDSSRIKYLGLMMMGVNIPSTLMWKTMSGEFVQMTQTLAAQIFSAIAAWDSQTFIKAEQHKAAMLQSNDPLNYDFKTGWPPIFGE